MESSKSLLVLSTQDHLNESQLRLLKEYGQTVADSMGMSFAVLPGGVKAAVHSDIRDLVEAMKAQAAAIAALAESNMLLIEAVAQDGEDSDPDAAPRTYMDGSPV